jgi:hypothetical protein
MENRFLSLLTHEVPPLLPIWLVWVVGIVLAVVFWRKHPMPSLLALLALLLMLLQSVFGTLASIWVLFQEQNTEAQRRMMQSALWGLRTLASAVSYGLLFAAVFGWRKPAAGVGRAPAVGVVEVPPETGIQRNPGR